MSSTANKTNGKVALITGASSGIGAATAIEFASRGYKLALFAKKGPEDEAGLAETLNKCLQANLALSPGDILTVTGDVTVEQDCVDFVNTTIEKLGKLDVLVNNAGIASSGNLDTVTLEAYDRAMNVNCRSVLIMTKLCAPHLIKTKGNIIITSSVAAIRAEPNLLPYCVSKAAVDMLTRCVALELAPKGVRVNSVNPGTIRTRIAVNAGLMTDEMNEIRYKQLAQRVPFGRIGDPCEVAKAIAFLASEEDASFMTGSSLVLDGGLAIK